MIEDKKTAKEIVKKILRRLKLKPCGSIDQALNDPTVRAYLGAVKDQKEKKYFLKARVQDLETEKKYFWKTYVFGQILKNHPQLAFNQKTPRLLEASFGKGIDYFLYEFIRGKDLGTKRYYDVIRLKMEEIDEILDILKALLKIPAKAFPQNYTRKGNSAYFQMRLKKSLKYGVQKYLKKEEMTKLKKIAQLAVFDQYLKFFSHGDFKPNNFIRSAQGIYVVDFEISSINNQFFDLFSIWGYAIRKPKWRRELMSRFLRDYRFKNQEERLVFQAEKVMFLLFELEALLWYLKRRLTKSGLRVAKRYLPQRVRELKEELENVNL